MGDNKNKKYIYIGIIVLCIAVTSYFLFFMSSGGGDSAAINELNTPVNTNTAPKPAATPVNVDLSKVEYGVPAIFPAQNKLQTTVLDSNTVIKSLNAYERVTVSQEEIDRDDPFAKY